MTIYDFTYTVQSWGAQDEYTRTIQEQTDEPEQIAIDYLLKDGAIGIRYEKGEEDE